VFSDHRGTITPIQELLDRALVVPVQVLQLLQVLDCSVIRPYRPCIEFDVCQIYPILRCQLDTRYEGAMPVQVLYLLPYLG
jgi:hypothetical protein